MIKEKIAPDSRTYSILIRSSISKGLFEQAAALPIAGKLRIWPFLYLLQSGRMLPKFASMLQSSGRSCHLVSVPMEETTSQARVDTHGTVSEPTHMQLQAHILLSKCLLVVIRGEGTSVHVDMVL